MVTSFIYTLNVNILCELTTRFVIKLGWLQLRVSFNIGYTWRLCGYGHIDRVRYSLAGLINVPMAMMLVLEVGYI